MVAATLEALTIGLNAGSLSSGLHHAKRDHGEGCLHPERAGIGRAAALEASATWVLVLELDAHMGGGTIALFAASEVEHIDIAVCPVQGRESGHVRLGLCARCGRRCECVYCRGCWRACRRSRASQCGAVQRRRDPHERSGIGALRGVTTQVLAEREAVVFDWARRTETRSPPCWPEDMSARDAMVTQDTLVDLYRLTLAAA